MEFEYVRYNKVGNDFPGDARFFGFGADQLLKIMLNRYIMPTEPILPSERCGCNRTWTG